MAGKNFLEVFPNLNLSDDLKSIFEIVDVTRIATNTEHTKIRIYIESSRLIEKSAIFKIREELKRGLRTGKKIEIQIVEKYNLSKQYTRENLFEIYRESIILELNEISPIIATFFKKAPVRFDESENLVIDLESSIVSEARMKTLKDTIENIFSKRFNMPLEVKIYKRQIDGNRYAKRNAKRLQNELDVLLSKEHEKEKEEPKKVERVKRPKKATYSDNPEVVYGKDFNFDEETKLCDVFEGTGACVIKGQVMTMEDRETRTGKFIVTLEVTDFTDSIAVKIAYKCNVVIPSNLCKCRLHKLFIQETQCKLDHISPRRDTFFCVIHYCSVHILNVIVSFCKFIISDKARKVKKSYILASAKMQLLTRRHGQPILRTGVCANYCISRSIMPYHRKITIS